MKTPLFKRMCLVALISLTHFLTLAQAQKQEPYTRCYFDEQLIEQVKANPSVQNKMNEMDNLINDYLLEKNSSGAAQTKSSNANLIIPVVVYVVHENGPENITDVQVTSQIDALNNYYSNYGIQFCFATKKGTQDLINISTPSGITSSTPGIFHYYNPTLTNHNTSQQAALTAISSTLSSEDYLKIWVVKGITSNTLPPGQQILGYATLPQFATASEDGIVMKYDAFGDVSTCSCTTLQSYSELGRIMVHETGHYLGLYHTFHGGCMGMNSTTCSTEGDKVCDTPPVNAPNSGCPASTWNTCNETPDNPDDINNYMDYVAETCMSGFTSGQNDRMLAAINLYRSNLVSSSNLVYTGVNCTGGLLADFTASSFSVCSGETVTFTAIPSPGATYAWDFGDGNTGSGATVTHTYSGAYLPADVILTVTNGGNSVSAVKPIIVEACDPIQSSEGIWYYGQRGGMSFSTGSAVYDNGSYINNNTMDEACAVQGTSQGNLLFYTNGIRVWDANHAQINGSNLLLSDQSAHRGALIVPNPANANQYYLFTKDGGSFAQGMATTVPGDEGFRYSIVQVNSGSAAMTANWNVPITPPASFGYTLGNNSAMRGAEGITAVKGCDGYWIITMGKKNSGDFITVWSLTNSGLSFVSETASPFPTSQASFEVSRDGKRLAVASGTNGSQEAKGLAVFDFDPYTGAISNQVTLNNLKTFGMSFSPDSKLLYSTAWGSSILYQYDMEAPSPGSSGFAVHNSMVSACEMQLGPDDKLYLTSGTNYVQIVHQPNERCTTADPNACLFAPNNGPLMQTILKRGFPNFIDASEENVFSNSITSELINCLTHSFSADICANTFSWNFGDPASGSNNTSNLANPTHTFSAPGTYTVTVTAGGITVTTTIQIGITATINGSGTICLSTNPTGNYSTNLLPGQTATWSVVGGGISGLNNQPDVTIIWTSLPGTVTLTITDPETGCTSTTTHTVTEDCQSPCECVLNPNFITSMSTTSCAVKFGGFHGGPSCLENVTYSWDFGDGNTATGQNVSNLYAGPGTYLVCLTVTASDGISQSCIKKICKKVTVTCDEPCECILNPSFTTAMSINSCAVQFNGAHGGPSCLENVTYTWDFGDGNSATGANASHTYAGPGTYLVCLTVTASDGVSLSCIKKVCKKVTVVCEEPCECVLNPSFTTAMSINSCAVQFTGAHGGPSCLENVTYTWDFGDGNSATGANASHTYAGPGTYLVCLTVTASDGISQSCIKKVCKKVTVVCEPCECVLNPSFITSMSSSSCEVKFAGMHGGPSCLENVTYTWDFGDGNTATGVNTNHTYSGPGTYTVCLTVTASDGVSQSCIKKVCKEITVECEPCECVLNPSFITSMSSSSCEVKFAGMHGGPSCLENVTYTWNFGDGNTATGVNANHTYSGPGTYTVCLTVTASDGVSQSCIKKVCKEITVECEPCECVLDPSFTTSMSSSSCAVKFVGAHGGPSCLENVTYTWDFGDGNTATGINPGHVYAGPGTYNVCLTVTASDGVSQSCKKKVCKEIVVECEEPCQCELNPNFTTSISLSTCAVKFVGSHGGPSCLENITYSWDFGDGNTATGINPGHIYAGPGTYTVCLTVTASDGVSQSCIQKICKEVTVNCLSGKKKVQEQTTDITIYPNPANDRFFVKLDSNVQGDVQVTLKSSDGKVISQVTVSETERTGELSIEIPTGIQNGMLFVEIKTEDQMYIERLMISK